jgi:hypothetical protein
MEVHMSSINDISTDPSDSPLDDTTLVYFEADPTHIGPFAVSRLRWKVDAPVGVRIELAGIEVPLSGVELVEPPATRTFLLEATARGARKPFGHAQVNVDLNQCRVADLPFVAVFIKAGITESGALPAGVYLREDPVVTIMPGRIQIHLLLGKQVPRIPDPVITLDMSFGLTVVPDTRIHRRGIGLASATEFATRLAATGEDFSASVTVPPYVWLVPWLAIPLAIGLATTEDSTRAQIPGIIQSVVDGLDASFLRSNPEGLQKHTVTIDLDDKKIGYVEVNMCPPPHEVNKPTEA